jgi:uncharacterized protein
MMKLLSSLAAGLLFGAGLALSGMTNPANVRGFLDVFGAWNPSLLFVMGGAFITTFIGYHFIFKQHKPLFEAQFDVPTFTQLDVKLLSGSALFGIGWGLSGYCPGPAVVSLINPSQGVLAFLALYALSSFLTRFILSKTRD